MTAGPRSVTGDSMLEDALAYVREGVPVFPLSGKIPFKNTHGHLDATTDESVIRRMWEEHPGANIGMPTGEKSGVFVVDPDGPKGAKTLAALEVEHGPLPETHEVRTGRGDGGRHLYFHQPPGVKIKSKDSLLGPKLDVKGDGGYVVVPPSIHPTSKRPYTLVNDGVPAEPPAWLLDLVRETAAKQNQPTAHLTGPKIPFGQHDSELTRIAGKLRRDGLEEEAIKNALVEVCEKRCEGYGTDYKAMCTKIARSVCRYDPAAEEIPGRLLITEGSNADRLVERFRPEIRFASDRKIWCVWDGTHWAVNDVMGMSRRMQEVARQIYFEAANAPEELRKVLGAWALKSESSYIQRGSIEEARNMVEVRAFSKTFDTHPRLLNVSNGTVNLETGQFRSHQREDFLTKIVDIEYRPEAECPRFSKFLAETFRGSVSLIGYVTRVVGYFLTGNTGEQKWWCFHGPTQSGKGTFVRIIEGLLGPYAYGLPENYFLVSKNTTDFATANLAGIRFAFCNESEEGRRLDVARIKTLTGEDTISAQLKHQNFFEFKPQCKLVLVTNYPPRVPAGDDAIWRRLKVVPFTVPVPDEKRIDDLSNILLKEEASGILNWAIAGFREWQKNGLQQPKEVTDATEQYRTSEDIVRDFLEESYDVDPNQDWRVPRKDVYSEYAKWSKESNLCPMSKKKFGSELQRLGITGDAGARFWHGVKLRGVLAL